MINITVDSCHSLGKPFVDTFYITYTMIFIPVHPCNMLSQ